MVEDYRNTKLNTMITKEKILEILKNNSQNSVIGWAVEEDDFELFADEFVKNYSIPDISLSLPDAKQAVAEMYSKEDWVEVLKDYEYGLGISKMIGFEELMDKVAEVYKGNEV